MKILIVEDDDASRSFLEIILKKGKYSFKSSDNGLAALAIFKEYLPDIVLSDINMSQMNGIELLGEIKKIKPDTIVIMLTAYNSERYVIESMKLGANNYLKKPIPRDFLINLLRKYQTIVELKKTEKKISDFVLKSSFTLRFKTDLEIIHSIVNYLILETENSFSEETKLDIKLGLGELILNSVEHGNLGISFADKNEAIHNDSLNDLYDERFAIPELAERSIEIKYNSYKGAGEWIIRDQGDGFDPELVPSPISSDGVLRLHGRGIFICKFQFDELEYLEKGNVVRVLKKF